MTENEMLTRRLNFVKPFQGNDVQAKLIPQVAAELFAREFGITLDEPGLLIPIVFSTAWKHIIAFAKSQPSEQFAIDVCGMSLEYLTEFSDSDKPTNIIPQMVHKRTPIFIEKEHHATAGATINEELNASYNNWRSVNLTEILDKVEQDTEHEVRTVFGIALMQSATVLPLVAATYTAGIQIARETGKTVNMYEIFEIDVFQEDGSVHLTPLATVKQGLKDDNKKS